MLPDLMLLLTQAYVKKLGRKRLALIPYTVHHQLSTNVHYWGNQNLGLQKKVFKTDGTPQDVYSVHQHPVTPFLNSSFPGQAAQALKNGKLMQRRMLRVETNSLFVVNVIRHTKMKRIKHTKSTKRHTKLKGTLNQLKSIPLDVGSSSLR